MHAMKFILALHRCCRALGSTNGSGIPQAQERWLDKELLRRGTPQYHFTSTKPQASGQETFRSHDVKLQQDV